MIADQSLDQGASNRADLVHGAPSRYPRLRCNHAAMPRAEPLHPAASATTSTPANARPAGMDGPFGLPGELASLIVAPSSPAA
jgi:hypothetical protein